MKKTIIALVFLTGCAGAGGEWAAAEQDAFMENCEKSSGGETEYCECALDEAMELESNPEDLTTGQTQQVIEKCKDEVGG